MGKKENRDFSLRGENGKIYYGWWIVFLGFILTSFSYAALISTTGVFLLPVTEELGFLFGDFSMYIMIMSFSAMAFLFFFTRFMTEKSMKKLMIISGLVSCLAVFGFSLSSELWHFYVLAVPLGFGFVCMTVTPTAIMVSNWFGSKAKGFALGLALLGPSFGGMGLIWFLNLIVTNFGWRWGYVATALGILLVSIPCTLLIYAWSPEKKGLKRMGEDETNLAELSRGGIPFKVAKKEPRCWLMLIAGSLIVFASSSILQHTQTYFSLVGYSSAFGANVVSLCTGALGIGCVAVGRFNDRFGIHLAAVACAVLFALTFVCQALAPISIVFVILMVICYGFGTPSVNEVSSLIANFMYGEKYLGEFVGYISIFISFGGSFGATVVGKMFDATGSYQSAWWMMAGVLLLAGLIRFYCTLPKNRYIETAENKSADM